MTAGGGEGRRGGGGGGGEGYLFLSKRFAQRRGQTPQCVLLVRSIIIYIMVVVPSVSCCGYACLLPLPLLLAAAAPSATFLTGATSWSLIAGAPNKIRIVANGRRWLPHRPCFQIGRPHFHSSSSHTQFRLFRRQSHSLQRRVPFFALPAHRSRNMFLERRRF